MSVGVLALQGDFREHVETLERLGVAVREIRLPEHLERLDGLIIPGGESTTIGRLAQRFGLFEPLRTKAEAGLPVWGTCAGLIFLARDVGGPQPVLGLLDVSVVRNAFGRQTESFEADLDMPALDRVASEGELGRPFHAVFIRAPLMTRLGPAVEALTSLPQDVADRQLRAGIEAPASVRQAAAAAQGDARLPQGVLAAAQGDARLPQGVVAARQGRLLATAFHPELTGDDRCHRFFLEEVAGSVREPGP